VKVTIDHILPRVTKPIRYLGDEIHSVHKDHTPDRLKVALAYPDVYELGMSNLGLQILYHILNRRDDVVCERVFAPWTDMEDEMRRGGLPLFALESRTPIREFDLFGISLQHELACTNVLNLLDLAGIPLHWRDRARTDPIIVGGGPCAFNPEPVADFFDCFAIGEGEEVIGELVDVAKEWLATGDPRATLHRELGRLSGVYVPALFDGAPPGASARSSEPRARVSRRIVEDLRPEYAPLPPIVPFCEITHDRLGVEVMRGCTRGCRFCLSGIGYRPVRERPLESVIEIARRGLRESGWDEVSFVSLSSSDYSRLEELVERLPHELGEEQVAISLPSLRPDAFSERLARGLSQFRRTGLTFAPECGSWRLGGVINKQVGEDALLDAIAHAYTAGWRQIKLYFMIGLPTETSDDLQGIVDLTRRAAKVGRKTKGRLKVSISPFVAKAHTPFQWTAQEGIEEMREKELFLRRALRSHNVTVKWRSPEISFLEGVLARGDRQLVRVIERAWRMGCRFDKWTEHFHYDRWERAFSEEDIDPTAYLRARPLDEVLPWDHIDIGVARAFLTEEKARSEAGDVTPDCREQTCVHCGLPCEAEGRPPALLGSARESALPAAEAEAPAATYGRPKRREYRRPQPVATRFRTRFRKTRSARFLSHLDLMRAIIRSVRRAGLPLAYSQGFRPHPRISFGPPLAVGMSGQSEFFDLRLGRGYPGNIAAALAKWMPPGIEVVEAKPIFSKARSLSGLISSATYRVEGIDRATLERIEPRLEEMMACERIVVKRVTEGEASEIDIRPYLSSLRLVDGSALEMTLRFTPTGTARPTEVLTEVMARGTIDIAGLRIERTDLSVEWDGEARSPMDFI